MKRPISVTPAWVHAAAIMPIGFAQVREDPRIDQWVVQQCSPGNQGLEVIQVASGGCTAAVLAAMPQIARLQMVDPHPAQLSLARMKIWMLTHCTAAERLQMLGHVPMDATLRANKLQVVYQALGLAPDSLGPWAEVVRLGPDHVGRYELVFAALRQCLAPWESALQELLTLHDLAEQQCRVAPATPLGTALDQAFAEVMTLEHLTRLFGVGATGNAVEPFHVHFATRLRHVLATLPAATNPYLWQLLRGTYPPTHPALWLTHEARQPCAVIEWTQSTMEVALAQAPGKFHLVHMSNILDWVSPHEAGQTLELAWRALRPGGWVVIRQLNSSLNIPVLGHFFTWSTTAAEELHQQDRSFFYRTLHVGRKL